MRQEPEVGVVNTNIFMPLEICFGAIVRVTRLDQLIRYVRRAKVPILMYHSVTSNMLSGESCLSLAGMSVNVHIFRKHMEYIANSYNAISLSDFAEWQLGIRNIPRNPCIITFDDGLLDVYENAVPILRELGLTATFFIIGKTLKSSDKVWPYDLYAILDSIPTADCISGLRSEIENFSLGNQASKTKFWRYARHYLGKMDKDKRSRFLEELRRRFNGQCLEPQAFISAQQIRELTTEGFQFGTHTMNHEYLSKLEQNQLEEEISECTKAISKIIGEKPEVFCYPYGGIDSWDKRVVQVLKKNSYLCAVSTLEGLNGRNTDLFALRRVRVTNNTPLSAFVFRVLGMRAWLWWLEIGFKKLKGMLTDESK